MTLPLETRLRIGILTIHPRTAPWMPRIDEFVEPVRRVDESEYASPWA